MLRGNGTGIEGMFYAEYYFYSLFVTPGRLSMQDEVIGGGSFAVFEGSLVVQKEI